MVTTVAMAALCFLLGLTDIALGVVAHNPWAAIICWVAAAICFGCAAYVIWLGVTRYE